MKTSNQHLTATMHELAAAMRVLIPGNGRGLDQISIQQASAYFQRAKEIFFTLTLVEDDEEDLVLHLKFPVDAWEELLGVAVQHGIVSPEWDAWWLAGWAAMQERRMEDIDPYWMNAADSPALADYEANAYQFDLLQKRVIGAVDKGVAAK